jgi:dTMP kinase
MIVVFEGIDGAGKTTQSNMLNDRLHSHGEASSITGPFLTVFGKSVRSIYLNDSAIDAMAEALLLASATTQMAAELTMKPIPGTTILDRYAYSTFVYHGLGRSLGVGAVSRLFEHALRLCSPNLVILLDLSPEDAQARLVDNRDRLDDMPASYHAHARDAYRALALADSAFVQLDGSGTPESVHGAVWNAFNDHRRSSA